MRKRTLMFAAIVLIGSIGVIAFLISGPAISAKVKLVSLTNDAAGMRWATLAVTNTSPFTLQRWGCYSPEYQSRPGMFLTHTFGSNVVLRPGQSEIMSVPEVSVAGLTSTGTWRAVLYFSRDGPRARFYDYSIRWPWLHRKLPGVPTEFIASEWLTP